MFDLVAGGQKASDQARLRLSATGNGWIAAGLALTTLLLRLPFRAQLLSNFDAVNYTLALERFDMRIAQPQAPGYLLYILVGRLFSAVGRLLTGSVDHPAALVWVSMIFSALAVGVIYWAGSAIYNRRVGSVAAVLLATSTVFWFMGEIVSPYAVDLFASAAAGWLFYHILRSSSPRLALAGGLVWGLAGAFRPQTMVFLGPLFLFALLNGFEPRRRSWKLILGSLLLGSFVFALFFIPAVQLSGGFGAFKSAMLSILPIFRDSETLVRTTRWERFARNGVTIVEFTIRALGELVVPLLLVGYLGEAAGLRSWRRLENTQRHVFLLLWFLPVWFVYFLIWPGNVGTILVSTPPLFLLAAFGFDRILEWLHKSMRSTGLVVGLGLLALVLTWRVLVFSSLPMEPFGQAYRRFDNRALLESQEWRYRSKLALVRQVPIEDSYVYADNFRHMQYYLPEYTTFSFPRFSSADPQQVRLIVAIRNGEYETWKYVDHRRLIPAHVRRLVFFDAHPDLEIDERFQVEVKSLGGYSIQVLNVPPGFRAEWRACKLELVIG